MKNLKGFSIIEFIIGLTIFSLLVLTILSPFLPSFGKDYSNGERTIEVAKLSYKGITCKTWEGYGLTGSLTSGKNPLPERFSFTVKDPAVLKKLQDTQGKTVTLVYSQWLHTNFCWGDTNYEITDVK